MLLRRLNVVRHEDVDQVAKMAQLRVEHLAARYGAKDFNIKPPMFMEKRVSNGILKYWKVDIDFSITMEAERQMKKDKGYL